MDRWRRVRIPAEFLKVFKEKYGSEVFITSIYLRNILVYPLSEWMKIASKASEKADDPLVRRAMLRLNRYGVKTEIDEQGRILIHKELRDKITIKNKEDHLIISDKRDAKG